MAKYMSSILFLGFLALASNFCLCAGTKTNVSIFGFSAGGTDSGLKSMLTCLRRVYGEKNHYSPYHTFRYFKVNNDQEEMEASFNSNKSGVNYWYGLKPSAFPLEEMAQMPVISTKINGDKIDQNFLKALNAGKDLSEYKGANTGSAFRAGGGGSVR